MYICVQNLMYYRSYYFNTKSNLALIYGMCLEWVPFHDTETSKAKVVENKKKMNNFAFNLSTLLLHAY